MVTDLLDIYCYSSNDRIKFLVPNNLQNTILMEIDSDQLANLLIFYQSQM